MTVQLAQEGRRLSRESAVGRALEFDTAVLVVAGAPVSIVLAVTLGETAGGLVWLSALALGLVSMASRPLLPAALKSMFPLAAALVIAALSLYWTPQFLHGAQTLAQFAVLPLVFLVGWRLFVAQPTVLEKLSRLALWSMPLVSVVFVSAWLQGTFQFGWLVGNAARPMVMTTAVLFVIGTMGRSRRMALAVGAGALFVALASGGRMGFLAIGLLMVFSPAVGLSWRSRTVLAAIGLVGASFAVQTEVVQERFFVGREEGTLMDIVLMRGNLNTAGRAENWPRILEECSSGELLGQGIGAAEQISILATSGATIHPHNEFIRLYCDIGILGSILFWSFFAASAVMGARTWRSYGKATLGPVAVQLVLALVAFSLTDNVTIYTSAFMAPACLMLGMAAAERAQRVEAARTRVTRRWQMA